MQCLDTRLCLVTDTCICNMAVEEMVMAALEAGIRWIQYREKNETRRVIYKDALRLRQLTGEFGASLIVNDYADIAASVEADGVHLGQDDLPLKEARKIMGERIIGISTHSLSEAMKAERDGADYIGFGPIFQTSTKDAGEPKGVSVLEEIKRNVSVPVVAIGGVSLENLGSVLYAGADAVAVASAILRGEISENVRSFFAAIKKHGKN